MKMKNLVAYAMLALGAVAAPFAAMAGAGDIYEIFPSENGSSLLKPGETLQFTVRLVSKTLVKDGDPVENPLPWGIQHNPLSPNTEAWDLACNPLKLGIVVSGKLREARIIGSPMPHKDADERPYTDIVFGYTVQPGDIAFPVRLALQGSTPNNPIIATPDGENPPVTDYCLINSDYWLLRNAELDICEFHYMGTGDPRQSQLRDYFKKLDYLCYDIDLTKSRFMAQGVEFGPAESAEAWRTVHKGTCTTMIRPLVETIGSPSNSVMLYVWAKDEKSVRIPKDVSEASNPKYVGRKVTMDMPDGTREDRWVYDIKVTTGVTEYEFDIFGVETNTTTELVLSPVDHYVYNGAGTLCEDFLTAKVACDAPPPPYVTVTLDNAPDATKTPPMGSDYNISVGSVQVKLSEAFSNDVTVALNLSIPAASQKAWTNYVGLSEYPKGGAPDFWTNVTFKVEDMRIGRLTQTLYVYAFGSDDDTIGPDPNHGIRFEAKVTKDNKADAYYSNNEKNIAATLFLNKTYPVISEPEYDATFTHIPGSSDYTFTLKASDTYKNLTDTNGYDIVFKYLGEEQHVACPTNKYGNTRWHFTVAGDLQENGGVFPVFFPSGDGILRDAEIWIVAPDGTTKSTYAGGPASAANLRINVQVDQSAMVTPVANAKNVNEGTTVEVKFKLEPEGQVARQKMYAFLIPQGAATNLVTGSETGVVIDGTASGGAEIIGKDSGDEAVYVRLKDGILKDQGGSTYKFKVALCSSDEYDENKLVKGYELSTLTLKAYNVEPTIKEIKRASGGSVKWTNPTTVPTFPIKVPKDVAQVFQISNLSEPGDVDKESLRMQWSLEEYDENGEYVTGFTTNFIGKASDETNKFNYVFQSAGHSEIAVKIWDKDMDSDSVETEYRFLVNVSGQPSVTVAEDGLSFNELDMTGRLTVKLSAGAPDTILVKATVEPYETPTDPNDLDTIGRLYLDPTKRYQSDPTKGAVTTNEYLLTFKPGTSSAQQDILTFSDLDGTLFSAQKGFRIKLEVDTNRMAQAGIKITNPDGKFYNEFFLCEEARVYVINDKPTVIAPASNGPLADNDKGYIAQIGANEARAITFSVATDAKADVDHGFLVTFICTGGGGTLDGVDYTGTVTITNPYATTSHKFVPNFSSQGAQQITLRIEDKDTNAGTEVFERTWYYDVQAAKTLRLVPHGPTGGFTTSAQSQRYANYAAQGHVWANVANPSMKGFNLSYNCGTAKSVDIYAWGYKTNAVDNGTLDGNRDVAIDASGNAAAVAPFFTYENDDDLDSFFYRWILIQGGGENANVGSIAPEHAALTAEAQGSVTLPAELGEDGAYEETVVEAVFAYEYLPGDNAGDINGDGIPDVAVVHAWKNSFGGVFDAATGEVTGNDLAKLDGFNDDEDYLPAGIEAIVNSLIPDTPESWKAYGAPFTAKLELRGYNEGLNDGPALSGIKGVEPDRVYTDPDTDKKSTLSKVEYLAWMEFKAANPSATEKNWSPERPTDPTTDDTDEDGFADGYEYYFWYRAHVGYLEVADGVTNHVYLSGERYDPLNPHKGILITPQEIEAIMDPLTAYDPATAQIRDSDNDGLPDLMEFELGTNPFHWDTDGDGLPDGYEVMYAKSKEEGGLGLDPLLAKSDETTLDGERNDDGDWMAITTYPEKRSVIGTLTADGRVAYYHFDANLLAGKSPIEGDQRSVKVVDDETVEGWLVTTADGTTNVTTRATVPTVEVDGVLRLAVELLPTDTWRRRPSGEKGKETVSYKGLPAHLSRGAALVEEPVAIEITPQHFAFTDTAGTDVATLAVTNPLQYRALTAWVYGRDWKEAENVNPVLYGVAYVDEKGTLDRLHGAALPHYVSGYDVDLPADLEICVAPGDPTKAAADDLWVIHHHVYQHYEYDPRTAWGPVSTAVYPGYAAPGIKSRKFDTYDEFLLMAFFYYSHDASASELTPTRVTPLQTIWQKYSTSPANADTDGDGMPDGWEAYLMSGPKSDRLRSPVVVAGEFPNLPLGHVTGALSAFSPLVHFDDIVDTTVRDRDIEWIAYDGIGTWTYTFSNDGLEWPAEFLGVETVQQYKDCPTIMKAYQDHIEKKGWGDAWKWRNKKWPTDPWAVDTDGDGIWDGAECAEVFLYGEDGPQGGGLNPLSWDTDGDGLPDPWELEFAGKYVAGAPASSTNASFVVVTGADGSVTTNVANTLVRGDGHWEGGMDGTMNDAGLDYDNDGLLNWQEYMTGTVRAWRYDDPCSRWDFSQYGTTMMGLMPFIGDLGQLKLPVSPEEHDPNDPYDWDNFWSHLLIDGRNELFNPSLGGTHFDPAGAFFSCCRHPWDVNAYKKWYYFADGIDHDLRYPGPGWVRDMSVLTGRDQDKGVQFNRYTAKYYDTVNKSFLVPPDDPLLGLQGPQFLGRVDKKCMYVYPVKYISCDPRKYDSDHDGMDDYYEVYHGLDPLLGASNAPDIDDQPCDLVFEAYNPGGEYTWYDTQPGTRIFCAENNFWLNGAAPQLRPKRYQPGWKPSESPLPEYYYDFTVYPWLAGLQAADADGDNIRNREEAILPNLQAQSTWHHTDPSALWMTDSSYKPDAANGQCGSLTRRYYKLTTVDPSPQMPIPCIGDPDFVPTFWADLNDDGVKQDFEIFDLRDFPYFKFTPKSDALPAMIDFDGVDLNRWNVASEGQWGGYSGEYWQWMFSFEEDEGYDADHDYLSDYTEAAARSRQASDPQDADDPVRRQAMYFNGTDAFLQTPIVTAELPPVKQLGVAEMPFLYYTVECWAKPDADSVGKQELQAIVERAIYVGQSNPGDGTLVRKNFLLGIKGGKWYTRYDSSGTDKSTPVEVFGGEATADWTHLAASFDGTALRLYVNGSLYKKADSSVQPEHGLSTMRISPYGTLRSAADYDYISLLVGADAATVSAICFDGPMRFPQNPLFHTPAIFLGDYQALFKGYVDELRVWDGAREPSEILADYRKRYTKADALENRDRVFNSYRAGMTRAPNSEGKLPAELKYHFTFDHLPGATQTSWVEQEPSGFSTAEKYDDAKAILTRPKSWTSTWWSGNPNSSVYADRAWVPWIVNTVYHLPYIDGSTGDSMYWSKYFAGGTAASEAGVNVTSFDFPLSCETTARRVNLRFKDDTGVPTYYNVIAEKGGEELYSKMNFTWRHRYTWGMDLLPMGGAYPKRISADEGGMWDEQGAADAWTETGDDVNGDGLPEWWLSYARLHYSSNLKPREVITRTTVISYYGVLMPAWQAYVRDLAEGMLPDTKYHDEFANTVDADNDGLPDWWEDLYGVQGNSPADADADPDNDALSNYAEYLLAEVYPNKKKGYDLYARFGLEHFSLDPSLTFSLGQKAPDYFLCYTNLFVDVKNAAGRSVFYLNEYFGEIVTDHDFMEDWWENTLPISYTSAKVYDPLDDKDEDGWSNWAECRAALWGGYFDASLIDAWTSSMDPADQQEKMTQTVANHPKPVIGVRATYHGTLDISGKQLVIRTISGQTPRVDATFVVPPSITAKKRYLGSFAADWMLHGHLSPGHIEGNSVIFHRAKSNTDKEFVWTWEWYDANEISHPSRTSGTLSEYLDMHSLWPHISIVDSVYSWQSFAFAVEKTPGKGSIKFTSGTEIGTIDLTTGEYEIDLSKVGDDPSMYVYRVDFKSRIGHEWPQAVYVSDTRELDLDIEDDALRGNGRVREGRNTIEAFLDLNGNGAFDMGEPFGSAQNVQIGWHKVPEVVIELKEESPVMPCIVVADAQEGTGGEETSVTLSQNEDGSITMTEKRGGGEIAAAGAATKKIRIVRESVNGQVDFDSVRLPERTLLTRTVVLDDHPYLTEADVTTVSQPDLDWKQLLTDAARVKLLANDIKTVTYRIDEIETSDDGVVTNKPIGRFTKEFALARPQATAVGPVDNAPVYSASPTFTFRANDDTATGYRLQVRDEAKNVVYDSGVTALPGRTGSTVGAPVYAVTPPIYVGAPVYAGVTNLLREAHPLFADGSNYTWGVTLYNAKYKADPDEWTTLGGFQTDVCNSNRYPRLPTGYGNVTLAVRYFGPTNPAPGTVVVEAFENADFRGQPMAQVRLGDTNDLRRIDNITLPNVVLRGLRPGRVFFRAFIDRNNDGARANWESWGYANMVGQGFKAIYNPDPLEVTVSTADWVVGNRADRVIYIEDTDVNKDELPDAIEDERLFGSGGSGGGDDPDNPEVTDPSLDSDGDGMPDIWENWNDGFTDPTVPDADLAADGDVMAYYDEVRYLVYFNDPSLKPLLLAEGETYCKEANAKANTYRYASWYYYGSEDGGLYGVGTNLTAALPDDLEITKAVPVTVRLVHAQVYARFGFNPLTANYNAYANGTAVNTRPFGALDKLLVLRYLQAIGATPANPDPAKYKDFETYVRLAGGEAEWSKWTLLPGELDFNSDKIDDGWELYVMYGPADFSVARGVLSPTTQVTPWSAIGKSRDLAPGGEGLSWSQEYDRGYWPTDPWHVDTDKDGVTDYYAYAYHLKGEDAGTDADGDGLSNYAEYLITEVFKCGPCDPDNPKTDGHCVDYFLKMGDLYVGEIFTDHDQVDDVWEALYPNAANRSVYDPSLDVDGDGWSNYAEFRAQTDPTRIATLSIESSEIPEYPVPIIVADLIRENDVQGKVYVMSYDNGNLERPTATWEMGAEKVQDETDKGAQTAASNANMKVIGSWRNGTRSVNLSPSSIQPGSVFISAKDLGFKYYDSNYSDDIEYYGYYGRDVAWSQGAASDAQWVEVIHDKSRDDDKLMGDLVYNGGAQSEIVGWVNYETGLMEVDLSKVTDKVRKVEKILQTSASSTTTGGGSSTILASDSYFHYTQIDLKNAYFKVNYISQFIEQGQGAVQRFYLTDAKSGHVREGLNTFMAFVDTDGDKAYTPGEPFGVVRDVDVGWQGAKFTMALTEASAITPRIDLWADASDRVNSINEALQASALADPLLKVWLTNEEMRVWYAGVLSNRVALVNPPDENERTHVRVIRYGIDDMFCYRVGVYGEGGGGYEQRAVLDKTFDPDGRDYLCEADFLGDGQFDIDWDYLQSEVVSASGVSQLAISNMTYLVVIGDGPTSFRGSKDTNTTVNALATMVTRRFEVVRHLPVAENVEGIVYGARPTFRWSIPDEEPWAKAYGSSYTAFKLQILKEDGKTVVYDSGVRRAPPQDRNGAFTWTADAFVGDKTALGQVFGAAGQWKWRVAMYNAKFKPLASRDEKWSNTPAFATAVGTQQETDDHNYSSVDVSVKYTGPALVLTAAGFVRVQAFESADFSGTPMAQISVTNLNSIKDATDVRKNGTLIGLPFGTYYVRAYIDSNGNGVKDDWESWGAAKEPVTVKLNQLAPIVGLYIEDADTDQDWLPDAWEMAKYGSLAQKGMEIDPEGRIVLKTETFEAIATNVANISRFLSGASLTFFQNIGNVSLALGLDEVTEKSIAEIRAMVEKNIDPDSVKITSLVVDPGTGTNGKVILTVAAKATDSIAGYLISPLYEIPKSTDVKIKVYRKENLAMEGWGEPLENPETGEKFWKVTITETLEKEVEVPITGVDFNSGFYKVEIVQ